MEVVNINKNNEEINKLFRKGTAEERAIAEGQLHGTKPEKNTTNYDTLEQVQNDISASNECFMKLTEENCNTIHEFVYGTKPTEDTINHGTSEQEQNNASNVDYQVNNNTYVQSQNTDQQTQPAVVPQNAITKGNQNEIMNPGFNHREEQKDKHRHQYSPIAYDNSIGCVTYVVKVRVNADDRIAMDKYNTLSREFRNERKADTIDIANMYIKSAKNYDTKIQIDINYINANHIIQNKIVYINKEDCINNHIVEALKKKGICCFNTEFSQKKISEYLYKLILSKAGEEVYDLPEYNGFNRLNEKYCFVTKEYCEENNYPIVTEKTFEMNLENNLNSEMAEQAFLILAGNHNSTEHFLLLNMIRIAGLLSNPLYWCGYKFDRIIFIRGESERIAKYLQIYERDFEILRPYSINVKPEKLKEYFDNEQDNVVMLEDKLIDSVYLKKNGIEAVECLDNIIFEHKNRDYTDYNFLTVVFSERLGQLMPSEKALVFNCTDFKPDNESKRKEFFAPLYYLDKLVVARVCSDFNDYKSCTLQNYKKYCNIADELEVDRNIFALLMLAYHEILRQYRGISELVSEEQMCNYLVKILRESESTYNGGSIADEFKSKMNYMLIKGELELVENSSLNNCYGSTGTVPVVFNDDSWLYITSDTFAHIVSKITLANNSNAVRKALLEKGWLKVSENMTYKATLYDNQYSGKVNVTAVSYSILSDEAAEKQCGGMFNYTPCVDDDKIERILIGTDKKGRGIYWSIGHDELGNGHMLVNGISGTGKSTAVNLIIKELFRKNKNIVYVDLSRSATPERLEKSGIDKEFQDKNLFRMDINSILENHSELETSLKLMMKEHKILLFEKKKYDSDVEEFLTLLYDNITEKSTLSIFLVIDEVHELDYKKGGPLYHIMEKGRGNGISLISIFQGPHETKPKQYSMMNQADIRLIFNLSDQYDAKSVAESNGLKPPGKFVDKIRNLKKRHCLVIGKLEDDRNELSNNRFIEVTIPDIRK